MFWKLTALSASSPVESVLDKEGFTLEDLLDEEEIIQECKALNIRLLNFLRDETQVRQLVRYIIQEPSLDVDPKISLKFPFVACEILMCEIDVILKTLVEEQELLDLLFSFLEPNRPHNPLLAGYFSKVVLCLMLRKTVPLMNYVQAHQYVFKRLVDLIGITSIMEVLIRLVSADDHVYPNFVDVMQWLADINLLEMIVDKLSSSSSPEVQANAAETLCAITRNAPSALATKLSSSNYVLRILDHALEDTKSTSGLVHSLSVCISMLDPKRSAMSSPFIHSYRNQHIYESSIPVNPETVEAMIPRLGDLLTILNVKSDEKCLPTTYGELMPPLGKHRLKIVEFLSVLLKTGNAMIEKELVASGTIMRAIDLFFEYAYNNALHHHVESIIVSCLETKSDALIQHVLEDCDLVGKMLRMDKNPSINQPTVPAAGRKVPRAGNVGHITRIANKLVQLESISTRIKSFLQESAEWNEWQTGILQERNGIENVYRWVCGRPTALQDRTRDTDEEDLHDSDYDVQVLANNLSHAFGYRNDDADEDNGLNRDEEDGYFDDESAQVVMSSLRLGDDQGSLFTNSNWFAFQDDGIGNRPLNSSPPDMMDDINLSGTGTGGNSSSDDEVVVGEDDELNESRDSVSGTSISNNNFFNGFPGWGLGPSTNTSNDIEFFRFDPAENDDLFGDRPLPEWVGWGEPSELQIDRSSLNPFVEHNSDATPREVSIDLGPPSDTDSRLPNGVSSSVNHIDTCKSLETTKKSSTMPSLFEEDVEFVGVELEGTEKAMDSALKEGIVGEAGPLKRPVTKMPAKETTDDASSGIKEYNDANYWRIDQEVAVLE